jgi:dihydroxyacetone kinase-like predicted kinase
MRGAWLRATGRIPDYNNAFENLIIKNYEKKENNQYCVNVLLNNVNDEKELIKSLKGFGNSMQVAKDRELLRIHLHSDNINIVRMVCSAFGKVIKYETDKITE